MLQFKRKMISEAALLATLPMLLLAVVLFPAVAAVNHEALLRDRLTEVRELLERRQAHRHMLNIQIEGLSLELEQLHLERKEALATLSEQVDQTRAYELELDRMMPRILPRLNRLETLRKQGARAIADLAKIGRNSNVEGKTKARLLATKTVSIDQMRRASTSVRILRRVPNDLVGRHRDLNFQIPLLVTALDRVSSRQERLQRRRDNAIRNIAELSVDVERLTIEEHRLARNMLARTLTATSKTRAGTQDRPMTTFDRRNTGKADIGSADIKSAASAQTQSGAAGIALGNTVSHASPSAKSMVPVMPGRAASGKASALTAGWTNRGITENPADLPALGKNRNVAALQAAPLDSLSSSVTRGQIEEIQPLVPTGETIGYTLADVIRQTDHPAIEIPAAPRQRVAAPDNGIVVFAGSFRSYGLLLIIEHDSEYHTLLWGFSSLDIEMGDQIQAGQIVGAVGTGLSPKLHVELRQNGEPVSPEVWLAASNSGVKG